MVCLAYSAFVASPPPATLVVRGRFSRVVCLIIVTTVVSFNYFSSRFSWVHSQAVLRGVEVGFEEPHLRLIHGLLVVEPGFPRISHISAYASHQGGLV